jgi:hypothetical protein
MTKDEVIKQRYPFYNPNIAQRDIEINAEDARELMESYLVDQLKGLVEYLSQVHPERIIERINAEIYSLEHGTQPCSSITP